MYRTKSKDKKDDVTSRDIEKRERDKELHKLDKVFELS